MIRSVRGSLCLFARVAPPVLRTVLITILVPVFGCSGSAIIAESPSEILTRLGGKKADCTLSNKLVRYLGFETTPAETVPGHQVTFRHYWIALRPIKTDHRIFIHHLVDGASGWISHADHDPSLATSFWPAGKVILDQYDLPLGSTLPGHEVEIRTGLFLPSEPKAPRLRPDSDRCRDSTGRILAGSFTVQGTPPPRPEYRAHYLPTPPRLDGRSNDLEWGRAPWQSGFVLPRRGTPARAATQVRMAWTDSALYIAVKAEDPDILATFSSRDAPLYREEALEVFVDPKGDGQKYFEFQTNPLGALFDATFTGGARKNVHLGFNSQVRAAVFLDGTVESLAGRPQDVDTGWSVEWEIPFKSITGENSAPKKRRWNINLFRVSKNRKKDGTLQAEESAWSDPLMGDFHNPKRFGRVWFESHRRESEEK